MSKCGLTKQDLSEIRKVLKSYSKIEKAFICGSQATNRFDDTSDVDLLLRGDIDTYQAFDIKFHLHENTCVPYFF